MKYRKMPIISPGLIFVQKAFLLGIFSGELIFGGAYFRGSLFSEGLIFGGAYFRGGLVIGRNFAFHNGFALSIKQLKKKKDNSLKQLKTANTNSPWAYIREG